MWSGNLSPDNSDLGSSNLSLRTVDESDLLAEVETGFTVSIVGSHSQHFVPPRETYVAALVSSTPSILIKLVPGVVLRLPRW